MTSRKPREKTYRVGWRRADQRTGSVMFFSPPSGTDWGGLFGMRVRGDFGEPQVAQVLVTAKQARELAYELTRRASDLESRKDTP